MNCHWFRHHASVSLIKVLTCEVAGQHMDGRLVTPICDLSDLASVERCAEDLLQGAEPIDSLVMNAGLQYSGAREPFGPSGPAAATAASIAEGHSAALGGHEFGGA
ncbi:hypothetical protein KBZ17_03060 [Cyanobium sp. A2C-AMD]|nr:hypothetical protein [Cyanobium sp. A2C-AMD]